MIITGRFVSKERDDPADFDEIPAIQYLCRPAVVQLLYKRGEQWRAVISGQNLEFAFEKTPTKLIYALESAGKTGSGIQL